MPHLIDNLYTKRQYLADLAQCANILHLAREGVCDRTVRGLDLMRIEAQVAACVKLAKARWAENGRWFGALPETVVSVDGGEAEKLIPKIRAVIENYKFRAYGDYNPWPGPNSNTFVQAALDGVPELKAVLPPTAIGKDYPYDGQWFGLTPSRTGVFVSLGGYLGLTIGWIEGIELNFFGGVLGFDIRRPALKLPGLGRLGLPMTQ